MMIFLLDMECSNWTVVGATATRGCKPVVNDVPMRTHSIHQEAQRFLFTTTEGCYIHHFRFEHGEKERKTHELLLHCCRKTSHLL